LVGGRKPGVAIAAKNTAGLVIGLFSNPETWGGAEKLAGHRNCGECQAGVLPLEYSLK